MSMFMRDVFVAGASTTRFGKFPDTTVRALAEEATRGALDDAGITPADVGMVFFANAAQGVLTNQEMIRGQVALRHTGLLGVPLVNVENACASASSAFNLACMAVGSGSVEIAMAVGAEKLTHPDKSRTFAAIGTAVDQTEIAQLRERVAAPQTPGAGGGAASRSFFTDLYAAGSRAYMSASGASAADFADVAVKSHRHAALNPKAQYRNEVTRQEVLDSRLIVAPLTLLMCSPIGDGAAALVVCSKEMAERLGAVIRVRAAALVSGRDRQAGEPTAVQRAAALAYEQAGVGPEDLSVVELHDAAASAELTAYESLGLCKAGGGPALLASGATTLGGSCPVNTSGGLLSKGHPIGATGCSQLVELTDQLRGRCGSRQVDGAQVALAQNGGGSLGSDSAAMTITILSAQSAPRRARR
jgi:acetyl-CoA acyltransferase